MLARSALVGDALAACVAGGGVFCTAAAAVAANPGIASASYLATSVSIYCLRRGALHRWPSGARLGAAEVLRRHIQYEREWHEPEGQMVVGRLRHAAHVAVWLLIFQPIYPLLEACLLPLDHAAFYFYYPRARGAGLVVDSRARRRAGQRGTAAQVLRIDWHRFELNVGARYPPPNPGRHPPAVVCNLPHIDLPLRRPTVRHWPWRQHIGALRWLLPTQPKPIVELEPERGSTVSKP